MFLLRIQLPCCGEAQDGPWRVSGPDPSRHSSLVQFPPWKPCATVTSHVHQALLNLQDGEQRNGGVNFKLLCFDVVCCAAVDNWDTLLRFRSWVRTANWSSGGPCPGCQEAGRMDMLAAVEKRKTDPTHSKFPQWGIPQVEGGDSDARGSQRKKGRKKKKKNTRPVKSSLVAQWVKDLALLQLWVGSLLWYGFDP